MKSYKNIIAILLLSLFSCMQLIDLHSLSHDIEDLDCQICKLISEDLNNDFLSQEIPETLVATPIFPKIISINYVAPTINDFLHQSFLNKPPPAL